ncbi:MAG: T9SS type A sorting domain-containing protein [Ignavibacteriae bacterium]|nr:T9SS type A sorting domain-containing protein [Ignavibacteriota bacterium]
MKHIRFLYVNLFLLFVLSVTAYCQTDTEFWFVAPEVSRNSSEDLDRPIFLRMSSFDHPSLVTVSQPANPSFTPITVNIAANSSQTVDLTPFIDIIENKPPDRVLNYGLYIKATKPIQAYYEVASLETNFNPELFALKGKNALGTHFIIPGQGTYNIDNNYTPKPYSSMEIVATSDSTSVTIIPEQNIVGHSRRIPYSLILNKGQTYSGAGIGNDPIRHLIGTEVTSDKPIAITIKDDMLNGWTGCADLIGDQIVPLNIIGTEYNAVKGFLGSGEKETVWITATEDNTNIKVWNSNYSINTTNKGFLTGYSIDDNSCHIESDKPIYVYQTSGIGCELGSALLPHTKCTGSRQVAFTRTTKQQLSMMIFTTSDAISGFTLNGNPNIIKASDFSAIPGTSNQWLYARLSFNTTTIPVDQTCIFSNSINFFHLGVLEGDTHTGCSYGFFSDYNSLNLGQDVSICPGDSAELDAGYGKEPYRWSNGSTERSIIVRESGSYWVIARLGNCEVRDTINVSFVSPNVLSIGKDRTICEGDSIFLSAGPGFVSYKWNTGETTEFIKVYSTGQYSVEAVSAEGCIQHDTVNVAAFDTNIRITYNGNPCEGDTVRLYTESGFSYYWWHCPTMKVLNWVNYLEVTQSGKYWVEGHTASGCIGHSDTIEITFKDNNLVLSSKPPSDSGKLEFGDVFVFSINCLAVVLTNNGSEPYILENVFLKHNTVFSIPQNQFAMNFAPGESKELLICFAPEKSGEQSDTLNMTDSCMNQMLILHGTGKSISFTGKSNCDIPIEVMTEDTELIYGTINPNKKIEVYNLLGIKVQEAESWKKLDVNRLNDGVYFLKSGDKIYKFVKM